MTIVVLYLLLSLRHNGDAENPLAPGDFICECIDDDFCDGNYAFYLNCLFLSNDVIWYFDKGKCRIVLVVFRTSHCLIKDTIYNY